MFNTIKENFNRALFALIFSIITIGTLSFLSFETPYGLFLAGSFGSSMVLLFGYPESPFAQPKNVFFGHLVTSVICVSANTLTLKTLFDIVEKSKAVSNKKPEPDQVSQPATLTY